MKIKNYKRRIVDDKIEHYLKLFGAITIEGPKYCGKTWAGRYHSNSEVFLHKTTGEQSNNVELAKISPSLVLEGEKPKLIDEWQEATNLWDEIRLEVDKTGLKGQYILTGSSTPNRKGISHSGAGRYGKIYLRTMSLFESGDSTGDISLKDLCNDILKEKLTGEVDLKNLAKLIIRGGWPANINYSAKDSSDAIKEYIKLIIDDDLIRLDGIKRDKHKVKLLLRTLARNESTTVSNRKLKEDINEIDHEDIDIDTLSSYLDALDRLYLLDNDEPFSTNIRSSIRVKQSEKRHFADPSIACSLLNISEESRLINDLETFGFLFEAMVERDLKIYADSINGNVYHYRDSSDLEVDAVIHLRNSSYGLVEIKLGGDKLIEEGANSLLKLKEKIDTTKMKKPSFLMILTATGSYAYQREDGIYIVPIGGLKN